MNSALPEAVVLLRLVVRFAETDLMGIVHHGVYAEWLEAGRVAWLDGAGIPYIEVARGGYHLAVTGLTIAYRTPARFGDTIEVATRLTSLQSRKASFAYEVYNAADRALLATGLTEHVCVDGDAHVARIPADIGERIRSGANALAARQSVEVDV